MKKAPSYILYPILLVLFLVGSGSAFSSDFYWINGPGSFNDPAHWSYSSGGASAGIVPGPSDNVYFDANSFTENYQEVTLPGNVTLNSFHLSTSKVPGFYGDGVILTLKNELNITRPAHFDLGGKIVFAAMDASWHPIHTFGISFQTDLEFANGKWELFDHLIASYSNQIRFLAGEFRSNNYTVAAQEIIANTAGMEIDFGTSHVLGTEKIILTGAINVGGSNAIFVNNLSATNPVAILGPWSGPTTKDVHVNCPNPPFMLDLLITSDYNGQDISCADSCDGELTIVASGTPGPWSYSIEASPFTSTTVYPGLCNLTYDFVVTDSSILLLPGIYAQCAISEGLIEPGALTVGAPITFPASCPDSCDAFGLIFPSGGTGPYTYFWPVSGETTTAPVALCAGWNTVELTDANGCFYEDSVFVAAVPQIFPDFVVTDPSCAGDCDAEIDAVPSGGNGGPFTVTWSPNPTSGAGTDPGIGFCDGVVTMTVFDVDGCPKDTTITIIDPIALTINVIAVTDAICFGECNGSATGVGGGGTPGYTFDWYEDVTDLLVGSGATFSGFCAGDYYCIISDAGGCQVTSPVFTIGEPPILDPSQIATDVLCFGDCNGTLDADVIGGTPGYTYSWETFPGAVGVGASDFVFGQCAGFYVVTITDANLCDTTMVPIEIQEPPPITTADVVTHPSCYDLCDGSVVITPAGGVPAYGYTWTPIPPIGGATATPSGMCDGTYDLTITDANGCTLDTTLILTNPPLFDVTAVITDIQCFGDTDGAIDVTVLAGGSGAGYTYTWVPVPPVGAGTPNISGLSAGVWTVTIDDPLGCDTTIAYTISGPTVLNANAVLISNVLCNGDCDGSAQVIIGGGTPGYTISWSSGGSAAVEAGLCAGLVTVTVTDANGCIDTDNQLITEPAPFDLDSSHVDNVCFGDCSGTATIIMNSGGTLPYSIVWDDPLAQTTFTAVGLCNGTYSGTVTDANGCDTTVTMTIISPAGLVIDTNTTATTCFGVCVGQIDVTVAGGVFPYTFDWYDATTGLPLGVTTFDISGLCPGDYYCEVTDASGCIQNSDTVTIIELPSITTSIISQVDATCGNCDGTADVSAAGGSGGFTFDWTPDPLTGDGTASVTGLCAGVYSILVTDGAGCTQPMSVIVNTIAVEVLVLDSTDATCFGFCDGSITATWGSIDPPYTVDLFFEPTGLPAAPSVAGAISPTVFPGLCADTYIVVLTNTLGCVTSDTITVNEPTQITCVLVDTDVTCNGLCDGTATVNALSGGVPGYSYLWSPVPGGGAGTPSVIGLCAGTWDVDITDATGCVETFSVIITEPPALSITFETSTDESCFGSDDGTATVAVSGGTAPISYDWFDCATGLAIGQTTPVASGLSAGSYQCVVTDANGCTVTSSCLLVIEPFAITAVINQQNVSCFGDCDGMLDAIPAGGVPGYFFQWLDEFSVFLPGQTDDTMSAVCQGIYNLTITDANGCAQSFGPFDMTAPTSPWVVTESQTNTSCFGTCDGTATVTVLAGNNPPYTYLWDDPFAQTTPTATNLCAGVYNVLISDAGVCDTTITFTILDNPQILANATITDVLCNGDCTGQVDVAPSGGTGPYTVTWSDLQVGLSAINLCAGAITCSITDANGCVLDTTITIAEPPALVSASVFSNPSTCGVCNGSATVNVVGGTGGYTYDWFPDPAAGEGTPSALGLCPGIVTCTITDANGCVLVEVFAISDINGEVLDSAFTDVSCFGVCDGTADVIYVCGDPGCTNQWYDGVTGLPIPGETGTSITGLCAQDYFCEVTNASGCITIIMVTIGGPTQIIPNVVITPVACSGDSNGALDLFPSGGSGAGYTFVWAPAPPIGDGTANVSGLSAGVWCVTITDSDGCFQDTCFTLLDPSSMTITPTPIDASCSGSCDGIISVTVVGGGGAYTYQWLDGTLAAIVGETGTLIAGLCAGNYYVEVTDGNGCIDTVGPVTISEPVPISAPIVGTDVTCNGACDGTVTVTPAGGMPPYIIAWYDSGGLIGGAGTTISGLCPEDYYAVVQDANGCNFTTATVTITEPVILTAPLVTTDASCFGFCDGTGTVVAAGGTAPYTYEWLDIMGSPIPGGTTTAVVNLCAGNYTVEVTDANGCTTGVVPFAINEFPAITGAVFTNDATCGVADGNATIFAAGGSPPLTYQWFDVTMTAIAGETASTILNQFAGTYWVEVTDANGCTQLFIALISNFDNTTLTWDAINHPSCNGLADGSIDITVTGANPPFTYIWNPGGLVAEDPGGLIAGDYDLQITDALGCINFYDTTLVDPPVIVITTLSVTDSDCGTCNGAIDIAVSGGTPALTIAWNTGATTASISGLCSGVYDVVVTDANGCTNNEPIEVFNTGGLLADVVITAITCVGACDGQAVVSGIGGTTPYSYLWLHDGSTSDTQTGLCAGSYFCQVTDAVGCTYTLQVDMLDPNAITVVTNMINPACGASDGVITVISSGGVLPHTYLWSTGGVTSTESSLSAGVYTLTITDAAGCTQDFTFGLSNTGAATAVLTGTDVSCNGICDGTLDTLSQTGGTAAFTYQWYDGFGVPIAGATNPAVAGLCAGDYMLEITDAAGCLSFQNYTLIEPDTILTNPLFPIDPTCFGVCDGSIISNPFGGTLPFTFLWDDPAAQTTSTASGLCDGTYTVLITDANGCGTSQTITITEPSEIIITVDSTVSSTCLNSADGQIWVTVSGGNPPYTYEYVSATLTDTFTVEDPTTLLPMDYYLTVTDASGCTSIDTITVDTLLVVLAIAGPDTLVCFGDTIIFNGSSNVLAGADFTWLDTLGNILSDTSELIIPGDIPNGVFTYVLLVSFGPCSHTDTVVLTVGDSLYVNAGPDIELYPNQVGGIGGSPTNPLPPSTIVWTPPIYLDDPLLDNPIVNFPQVSTWYYVTLTDSNGCTAIDSMWVEVLPDIIIPDGISPNGDGLNDTWILDFLDQYPGVPVEINVYNRWGEVLFISDQNYADDWGGTSKKGHRLMAGTYYYTIKIDHPDFPEPFTGPITIMW